MYRIKLFFPCEIEERSKRHPTEFDKIESGESNKIVLNSSIIQINKLSTTKLFPEYQSVDKILESCHLSSLEWYHFVIENIIAPYGVVLSTIINSYKEMKAILKSTNNDFLPCISFSNDDRDRPYWLVYDRPIILVEYISQNKTLQIRFRKKLQENHLYDERIKIEQNYICIKDNVVLIDTIQNSTNDALANVLNVYMAINQLWARVRIEGKKLGHNSEWSEKEKKEKLIQVHEMCAVFAELTCSTIFLNYLQRKIFDFLYPYFKIKEKNEQILSAKEHADFLMTENVNQKASSINTTAFVTGYIGILLAFFAFFPLEVKDVFWICTPISQKCKLAIFGVVTFVFVIITGVASWGYTKYSSCKNKKKIWWSILAFIVLLLMAACSIFINNPICIKGGVKFFVVHGKP